QTDLASPSLASCCRADDHIRFRLRVYNISALGRRGVFPPGLSPISFRPRTLRPGVCVLCPVPFLLCRTTCALLCLQLHPCQPSLGIIARLDCDCVALRRSCVALDRSVWSGTRCVPAGWFSFEGPRRSSRPSPALDHLGSRSVVVVGTRLDI